MADPAHSPGPILEVGRVGFGLVGGAVIADGPNASFADVLSPGDSELVGADLAVSLDVALEGEEKLVDRDLLIHE